MNNSEFLENTIQKLLTEEGPEDVNLENLGEQYRNVRLRQHMATEEYRSMTDVIAAVCWTTGPDCMRKNVYYHLSAPGGYRRNLPFSDGDRVEMHAHSHIELTYIVQGQVRIRVGEKDRLLRKGELLLINSGTMHAEYLGAEHAALVCLDLDDSFFEMDAHDSGNENSMKNIRELINRKRNEYSSILFTPTAENGQIIWYLACILQEFCRSGAGRKRMLLGLAERFVDLLPREFHMQIERKDTVDYRKALISDIREVIRQNCRTITAAEISGRFHYSTDYLNRLLKKENSDSLGLLIQKARMAEALKLLDATDLSIEEIASEVGYHNLGFFYRKFREIYGLFPGELRKLNAKGTGKPGPGEDALRNKQAGGQQNSME